MIPGVPFLPQQEESCGPSSLAMLLRFLGADADVEDLVRETQTPGLRGTLITDLAAAARRRGFEAQVVDLDFERLGRFLRGGTPAVLLVDLGWWVFSRPHFLLAYGVTPEGIVAHSGREPAKVIPLPALEAAWAKMGRLALLVQKGAR